MLEHIVPRIPLPAQTGIDWAAVPALTLAHAPWLPPCDVRAIAQVCHDGQTLYLRMQAAESPVRAQLTGPLAPVCEDSCLEFFLAPDADDPRYLNFEWNPNGALFLGFGAQRETRVRQIVSDPDALLAPRPFATAQGWGIEFRVPASFVRLYMPGFALRGACDANFYKCGDRTAQPHYLAWAPLSSDQPDFHRRGDFGRLWFA